MMNDTLILVLAIGFHCFWAGAFAEQLARENESYSTFSCILRGFCWPVFAIALLLKLALQR